MFSFWECGTTLQSSATFHVRSRASRTWPTFSNHLIPEVSRTNLLISWVERSEKVLVGSLNSINITSGIIQNLRVWFEAFQKAIFVSLDILKRQRKSQNYNLLAGDWSLGLKKVQKTINWTNLRKDKFMFKLAIYPFLLIRGGISVMKKCVFENIFQKLRNI